MGDVSPPLRAITQHERYHVPPAVRFNGGGSIGKAGRVRSYSATSPTGRPGGRLEEVEVKEMPGQNRRLAHLMSEQKRRE
jgi:hypothetical protein